MYARHSNLRQTAKKPSPTASYLLYIYFTFYYLSTRTSSFLNKFGMRLLMFEFQGSRCYNKIINKYLLEEGIMSFYDLKCNKCGKEFNVMASMNERESKKIICPECGSNELDRIYGNINVIQSRKSSDTPFCPNAHKCGGCCGH